MLFCAAAFVISALLQQQIDSSYVVPVAGDAWHANVCFQSVMKFRMFDSMTQVRTINIGADALEVEYINGTFNSTLSLSAMSSSNYVEYPSGTYTTKLMSGSMNSTSTLVFSGKGLSTVIVSNASAFQFQDSFDVSHGTQASYVCTFGIVI